MSKQIINGDGFGVNIYLCTRFQDKMNCPGIGLSVDSFGVFSFKGREPPAISLKVLDRGAGRISASRTVMKPFTPLDEFNSNVVARLKFNRFVADYRSMSR